MATAKKTTTRKPAARKPAKAKGKTTAKAVKKMGKSPIKAATKKAVTKKSAAKPARRGSSGKRELINTGTDKRYVRRRTDGTFVESDDVSRSLSADRRRKAKTKSKPGQGDRGDRKR